MIRNLDISAISRKSAVSGKDVERVTKDFFARKKSRETLTNKVLITYLLVDLVYY